MSDGLSASNVQEQTPKMRDMSERSTKLIDDHQFIETVSDYLTDNPDFTVVGVIGPQGVGKSTILNYIGKDLVPVLSTFYLFQHCVENKLVFVPCKFSSLPERSTTDKILALLPNVRFVRKKCKGQTL
jgi:predicted AAA+ superfamily ATPase